MRKSIGLGEGLGLGSYVWPFLRPNGKKGLHHLSFFSTSKAMLSWIPDAISIAPPLFTSEAMPSNSERSSRGEHNGYVCMWWVKRSPALALAEKKCGFRSVPCIPTNDGIVNGIKPLSKYTSIHWLIQTNQWIYVFLLLCNICSTITGGISLGNIQIYIVVMLRSSHCVWNVIYSFYHCDDIKVAMATCLSSAS